MALASVHRHNQTVLNSLEEGDLVEFPRCIYSHWAVYIGKEEVVHLTEDPHGASKANANSFHVFTVCGKEFPKAIVKRDNFFDVAAASKAKKNNDKDKKVCPSDRRTIVKRALSTIGVKGYNILWKNCEFFASWCRYGEGWSEQTNTALTVVGVAAAVVGVLAVLGKIFGSKEEEN